VAANPEERVIISHILDPILTPVIPGEMICALGKKRYQYLGVFIALSHPFLGARIDGLDLIPYRDNAAAHRR
jgi:hypothetical protein